MSDGLGLHISDIYPGLGIMDTNTKVVPDVDDKDALNEDTTVAEQASTTESSKRNVLIALAVIAAMVIFLGMGGK